MKDNAQMTSNNELKLIEPVDLIIYMLCTAGEIIGYTKFHRIAYLINKKFQNKNYAIRSVNFSDRLFDGPFDKILQKKTEALGNGEFLDNLDVEATQDSKIFTHSLTPKELARMRMKDIESDFKDKLGAEDLKEIKKLILDLRDKPLKEIDRFIETETNFDQDYISISELPEDIKQTILQIQSELVP